jgi:hypothetical protein
MGQRDHPRLNQAEWRYVLLLGAPDPLVIGFRRHKKWTITGALARLEKATLCAPLPTPKKIRCSVLPKTENTIEGTKTSS